MFSSAILWGHLKIQKLFLLSDRMRPSRNTQVSSGSRNVIAMLRNWYAVSTKEIEKHNRWLVALEGLSSRPPGTNDGSGILDWPLERCLYMDVLRKMITC
jgi:hypothetical protein